MDDRIGWRAVLPALATVTVGILPGFLTAGVAVQMSADVGLTVVGLGVVIGIFFGASALASSPMGAFAQRLGWAPSLRTSAFLAVVTLAGIALSARTPTVLAIWFLLGGVAGALGQPAANLVVARCVPADRRGLLFGVKHAAVPTATMLGGLAVPTFAVTAGWRWAFWGGALLALVTALLVPRQPSQHEVGSLQPPSAAGKDRISTPMSLLIALAVAAVLGIGGIDALASFIVTYAVHIGVAEGTAGFLLAAGSLTGIASRLLAGWIIDRTARADLTAVASMLTVGALGVAGIAAGARSGLVLGGLVAFAAGWGWSGLFTFAVVKDNPQTAAAATGITQTGVFVGAAIGPPVFGLLAERASFAAAWWATAAALVGAAVIVLYVRAHRPAQSNGTTTSAG